jgi:hypothetical protein
VAIALAKLGDPEVAQFVQLAATHARLPAERCRAVIALGHMAANVSQRELNELDFSPGLILRSVAEIEHDAGVRMILADEMLKPHIKLDLAEGVFDRMQFSRHATPPGATRPGSPEGKKTRPSPQYVAARRMCRGGTMIP